MKVSPVAVEPKLFERLTVSVYPGQTSDHTANQAAEKSKYQAQAEATGHHGDQYRDKRTDPFWNLGGQPNS